MVVWAKHILILCGLSAGAATIAMISGHAPHPWAPEVLAAGRVAAADDALGRQLGEIDFDQVLWVDARAQAQRRVPGIPRSVSLNEETFEADFSAALERWDGAAIWVVYCESPDCGASRRVVERLRAALGVDDVYYLIGGFAAWKEVQP